MSSSAMHSGHDHDGHHHDKNEHVGGFSGWHFIDVGSDLLRSAMKPLNRTLERIASTRPERWTRVAGTFASITSQAMRVLPVVGVAGEAVHVYTPFQRAREDWEHNRISSQKFAGLSAVYAAYTLTGLGGILTSGAKEGITHMVEKYGLIEERYIPHTLYKELQHAGIIEGEPAAPLRRNILFDQAAMPAAHGEPLPSPHTPATHIKDHHKKTK